jgi:hypothetical protein
MEGVIVIVNSTPESSEEKSAWENFLASESEEKPSEKAGERLNEIARKILDLSNMLNCHSTSAHERAVWRLLMAAMCTARAGSEQNKEYAIESIHAAIGHTHKALQEFGSC